MCQNALLAHIGWFSLPPFFTMPKFRGMPYNTWGYISLRIHQVVSNFVNWWWFLRYSGWKANSSLLLTASWEHAQGIPHVLVDRISHECVEMHVCTGHAMAHFYGRVHFALLCIHTPIYAKYCLWIANLLMCYNTCFVAYMGSTHSHALLHTDVESQQTKKWWR